MRIGVDFRFSKEEQAFRQEVRQFLREELPPDWVGLAILTDWVSSDENWERHKLMARKLGEKGWLTLTWPREYGGQARSPIEQIILLEEMAYHRAPGISFGIKMLSPVLIAYGTEEQKNRFLPAIARGEIFWCQGFSEAESGSDLASLQTHATEVSDGFIVNGRKIWTTGAHRADWCFFLARTDQQNSKHKGISLFLVDMRTAGISVRPIFNMMGEHDFNEVFFDEVKIPKENLVGEMGQGWGMAMSLLSSERSMIEQVAGSQRLFDEIVNYLVGESRVDNPSMPHPECRRRLADVAIQIEIGRLLAYQVGWMQSKGLDPSGKAAILKVHVSEMTQNLADAGMQILGIYGLLDKYSKHVLLRGLVERSYVGNLVLTIGAGTNEVQRTLIATRVLGLPR